MYKIPLYTDKSHNDYTDKYKTILDLYFKHCESSTIGIKDWFTLAGVKFDLDNLTVDFKSEKHYLAFILKG